jgi:hypothetical protein
VLFPIENILLLFANDVKLNLTHAEKVNFLLFPVDDGVLDKYVLAIS